MLSQTRLGRMVVRSLWLHDMHTFDEPRFKRSVIKS